MIYSLFKIVVRCVLALLAIVALLIAGLNFSSSFREQLIAFGLAYLPENIVISGVKSPALQQLTIETIELDAVKIEHAELDVSLLDLVQHNIVINKLIAQRLFIKDTPPSDEASEPLSAIEVPQLPVGIDVRQLQIRQFAMQDWRASIELQADWPLGQHLPNVQLSINEATHQLQLLAKSQAKQWHLQLQSHSQEIAPLSNISSLLNVQLLDQGSGQPWLVTWQQSEINAQSKQLAVPTLALNTSGQLSISKDFRQIDSFDIELIANQSEQHLAGSYLDKHLILTSDIQAFDLAMLAPWVETLSGSLSGKLAINYHQTLDIQASVSTFGHYLQQEFALVADVSSDLSAVNADVQGQWAQSQINTQASYQLDTEQLDAQASIKQLRSELLPLFAIELPSELAPLSWIADTDVSVAGTLNDLHWQAALKGSGNFHQAFSLSANANGDLQQANIDNATLTFADDNILSTQGSVNWQTMRLDLNSAFTLGNFNDFSWTQQWYELPDFIDDRRTFGQLEGRLYGQFDALYFAGKVQLNSHLLEQTTQLKAQIGELTIYSGALSALDLELTIEQQTIGLQGDVDYAGHNQFAWQLHNVDLTKVEPWINRFAPELTLPSNAMTLQQQGTFNGTFERAEIKTSQQVAGSYQNHAFIAEAEASASGLLTDPNFAFDLTFLAQNPEFPLGLNTRISGKQNAINIHEFKLGFAEQSHFTIQGDIAKLDTLNLSLDTYLDLNEAQLAAAAFGYDLNIPEFASQGQVRSQLSLTGKMAAPSINGISKANFTIENKELVTPITLNLQQNIRTLNGRIEQELGIKLNSSIDVQFVSSSSQNLATMIDEPLTAQLKGNVDLAKLWQLLPKNEQKVAGQVVLNMAVNGTANQPELQGFIDIRNGQFADEILGIEIRNIEGKFIAIDQSLKLNFTAQDNAKGRISGKGDVLFEQFKLQKTSARIELSELHLLQRADIDGKLSGKIELTGTPKRMDITGLIDINPLSIRLDRFNFDDIPQVQIEQPVENSLVAESKIFLNIDVTTLNRARIYGLGLDAEIKGSANIKGTAKEPKVAGTYDIEKGRLDLLGKRFVFQQGVVRIEDKSVMLDLRAVNSSNDYEFFADVSGTDDNIKVELSSSPSLPQDQIVSRLMFGQGVENVSAIQAVMLASALTKLSTGNLGGFDALKTTSDVLQLDNLDVSQENDNLQVTAGKYLNDKVYFEVDGGAGEVGVGGSVKIELLPQLDLETYYGSGVRDTGIELQWSYDY